MNMKTFVMIEVLVLATVNIYKGYILISLTIVCVCCFAFIDLQGRGGKKSKCQGQPLHWTHTLCTDGTL